MYNYFFIWGKSDSEVFGLIWMAFSGGITTRVKEGQSWEYLSGLMSDVGMKDILIYLFPDENVLMLQLAQ